MIFKRLVEYSVAIITAFALFPIAPAIANASVSGVHALEWRTIPSFKKYQDFYDANSIPLDTLRK